MFNNILEISKKTSKGGRVPIKIALLKIHNDPTETNKNGIHWKREYVLNNIESANMMPICAEFADEDKEVPLGHGLTGTGTNADGLQEPEFLNSETVGVIESASIEEFEDENNGTYELLVGSGYLYNQRYPKFVTWVRKNYAENHVDTSIEIMGTPENDNSIVYEGECSEEFRIPKIYVFSGTVILGISPGDDNAIVLEVAQKKKEKREEQHMEFNKEEVKSVMKEVMTELNSKDADHATEVQKLNDQISELNEQIETKDATIEEKENKISELNASVEEMQKLLKKMEDDRDTYWQERSILEQEIAKAKVQEKLAELDSMLGEFNEEEQTVAQEDIDQLKENLNACKTKDEVNNYTSEINSIKSKICMAIVEKQKEDAKKAKIAEQNSNHHVDVDDIFSEISSEDESGVITDNNDGFSMF